MPLPDKKTVQVKYRRLADGVVVTEIVTVTKHGEEESVKKEPMPPDIRRKLFDVRCRSKSGQALSEDDRLLINRCWALWPEEFRAMEREVFEATKPFGSM